MRPIERRLSKIEDTAGPPGNLRSMTDAQLHALICKSLTQECRAGKTLEEIIASYKDGDEHEVAEIATECYCWDAATRSVRLREDYNPRPWENKLAARRRRAAR